MLAWGHGCRASVSGMLACVVWVRWVACEREWHAIIIVIVIIEILSWRKKKLNVHFWNKNEKIYQTDLNSDLKEEPYVKSSLVYIIWAGNARILSMPDSTEISPNVGKYNSICVTLRICLNMRETLLAEINQSSKYTWICLKKVQNMYKLLLSNTWIMCLKLTKFVYGSEYAWLSHGFGICLNIHEYI